MALNTVPLTNSARDLEIYRRIFANNGYPRPIEHMRWLCGERDLPLHGAFTLEDGVNDADGLPKAGAIYTTLAAPFKLGEDRVLAVQSMDTMTDENYRGRGLFIQLANHVYTQAAEAGVAMVYGFPNANSRSGFFNKLDWVCHNPVPFLIRPMRSGYFSKRLAKDKPWGRLLPDLPLPRRPRWAAWPGLKIEQEVGFPEDTDALWENYARCMPVGLVRNREYLTWRYLRKPDVSYRIYSARGKDGSLRGLVVTVDLDKHGGRVGYLMELMFQPGETRVADALIAHALSELARSRCDAVLTWWLPHRPGYGAFLGNGFMPMPEKLRPIELNFGCRTFDSRYASLLNERRNWHLSYSDSDTV